LEGIFQDLPGEGMKETGGKGRLGKGREKNLGFWKYEGGGGGTSHLQVIVDPSVFITW